MKQKEYIELFHRAQVNLVAFKLVVECDEELKAMVELAIKEEREACATVCDRLLANPNTGGGWSDATIECSVQIRARGEA